MESYSLERNVLLEKIKLCILEQKNTFLASRLGREFYQKNKNKYDTKESSILVYFSSVCKELLNSNRIRISRVSNRGDSLRWKYYEVI